MASLFESLGISDETAQALPTPVKQEKTGAIRTMGDMAIKGAQGVVDLGASVVGLGNIVTGGAIGRGMDSIGYDPQRTNAAMSDYLSTAQKESDQRVQSADGFVDTVAQAVTEPRFLAGSLMQSLPGILAMGGMQGAAARAIAGKAALGTAEGAAAAAGKSGAAALEAALGTESGGAAAKAAIEASGTKLMAIGAASEGAQTTGNIAQQAQQAGRTWSEYAPGALGAGVATGAIGFGAGKLMGDAGTEIFTGAHTKLGGSTIGRMGKSAFSEGVLEEMPQSASEQAFTNIAMGEPDTLKGVGNAAATGLVTGGAMGLGMGGFHGKATPQDQTPVVTPEQAAADTIRATELVPESGAMTRAVNAGTEAKAKAVESMSPMDSFANELNAVKTDAQTSDTLQKIRDSKDPTLGVTTDEFLNAVNVAGDPGARMDLRQLALDNIKGVVEHFKTGASIVQGIQPDPVTSTALATFGSPSTDLTDPQNPAPFDPNTINGESRFVNEPLSMRAIAGPETSPTTDRSAYVAPLLQSNDILNSKGKPFPNLFSANRAAKSQGDGFQVVQLANDAFVVRQETPVTNSATPVSAEAGAVATQPTQSTPADSIQSAPIGVNQSLIPSTNQGVQNSSEEKSPDQAAETLLNPVVAGEQNAEISSPTDSTSGKFTSAEPFPTEKPAKNADHVGRNNIPLADGGKPFKTKVAAQTAKKLQPALRVVKTDGGFALAPKSDKQLAAEQKAAKRMGIAQTSKAGAPIAAHEFIAGEGGMDASTKSEFSFGDNPRVGNRRLFAGKNGGMTIEAASQKLIEHGYLKPNATHSDVVSLINRSFTQPQYTAEGTETAAQAEMDAQYQDYLSASQDESQADDFDPFQSVEDIGFVVDDFDVPGYDAKSDPIKVEVNALVAQADALGIDTETIKLDASYETSNQSEQAYFEAARTGLQNAINGHAGSIGNQPDHQTNLEQGRQDAVNGSRTNSSTNTGETGNTGNQSEGLTATTPEQVKADEERAAKAESAAKAQKRADDERLRKEQERKDIAKASVAASDSFELGQDPLQSLSGQQSVFDTPADLPASKTEAIEKPAEKPTQQDTQKKPDATVASPEALRAQADLQAALADLGDIFGKNTRLNMMPEQEAKILPVMVKLFDAAFRLGYHKFKDAAKFALDKIRAALGDAVADDITLEHLQGAYISMSSGKSGVDGIRAVSNIEAKSEIESHKAQTDNERNGETDVPSTNPSVERDSAKPSTQPAVGDSIQDDTTGAATRAGNDGGRTTGVAGSGQQDGAGVSTGGTTATGERSDQRLHPVGQQPELTDIVTGTDFREPGGDSGIAGISPEPISASQVDAVADKRTPRLKNTIERNKANKATVVLADLDSIKATLPQLLPGQQEDVQIAERRFAKTDGYGMLFTNGTGTGKTFTGLGIIKRNAMQGKTNTLIVVPDTKIAADWIESGKLLALDITALKDTKDAGKGVVVTTYANLGENDNLAKRQWDVVVADEAHSLMQAAIGEPTGYLYNLRAITYHPDGVGQRHAMLNRKLLDQMAELQAESTALGLNVASSPSDHAKAKDIARRVDALSIKTNEARKLVQADVDSKQGASRTRLVALSATPFAYEKTIDWANGYLFDYNEGQTSDKNEFRGYNQGDNKDRYMMQNFGYSMRYNKLTRPDANVDAGLMQRQWNANLKKSGALSGRMLDVVPDYDRRFILVESAIGNRIDEALEWISDQRKGEKGQGPFGAFSDAINEQFKYLQKRYLLEAIKATEVIPIVKKHMKMGRKVVVFHDYKKGGGFNPFRVNTAGQSDMAPAVRAFEAKFSDLVNAPLGSMPSPIDVFSREIPGVLLINGDEKKSDLLKRYKQFQDDASGPLVMLVQSAKNKGWSGHDTTGKHQRVLINLGQPTAPTLAIQQEGRIYRTGQASDAIMRYMNTGTNWERWTFASTIATRASTAENLGMGEMARALKDSFIQSFEESDAYEPGHEGEGKGGKERDKAANDALTEFDRAKTMYFAQQKKNSRTKSQDGTDYFATPEPVGLKMVQWLDSRGGESTLEPSAGHGAIARWLPDNTNRTAIEPSFKLRSKLALVMEMKETGDRIIDGTFEDHHIGNKYDGIVMNPPFGTAGRTAIDHLAKAATHLRDGGRIVALIPTGPAADAKFDKWFYESSEKAVKPAMKSERWGDVYKGDTLILQGYDLAKNGSAVVLGVSKENPGYMVGKFQDGSQMVIGDSIIKTINPTGKRTESFKPAEGLGLVANIKLPSVTFERAGTAVATRIVVIEKNGANVMTRDRDYSDITDIKELFDKLENLDFAARTKPVEVAPVEAPKAEKPAAAPKAEKVVVHAGDEVTIGGTQYEIEIYTTNAGKEKRGVWMASKAEASKYSARAFTHSSNKGKWFVDEYWFPKDAKITKPDAGNNGSAMFSRGKVDQSDRTLSVNESNREKTNKLQSILKKQGHDFTITPVSLPINVADDAGGRTNASIPKNSFALAERIASVFGKEVVWVDAKGTFFINGVVVPGGSLSKYIFINANAEHPSHVILGHELTHHMEKDAPGAYKALVKSINGLLRNHEDYRQKYGIEGVSDEFVVKEMLGDLMGDNFDKREFWNLVAKESNGTYFRIIANSISKWLTELLMKLKKNGLGSHKFATDIQEVRSLLAKAVAEYAKTNGATSKEDSIAKFSRTKIVGETTRKHTPEQLRAMKNVGFQVEVPTLKDRAQALWKDAGKKLAQGIADQFAPIKDMDMKAYGLMRLAKGASGAFESLLHGGLLKLSDNVYDFDEKNKGGVIEKLLIPLQGEHHDFMRWVAANRAERLMNDGKEHLFSKQDIADLKTLATGQAAFDYTIQNGIRAGKITRDRAEIYRDSLATFNTFNKNVLDMAEQSGLIDGASRALWEQEFYVPFYRVANDSDGGVRGMNIKGGVIRQQAFKALKGSKNALNADLLDNTLMNWAHLIDASAKNRAAKATIEAAERLGVAIGGNQAQLAQMGASVNNKNGVVWFMDGGIKRYSLIDNQGDGAFLMTAITALEYAGMRSPIMNAMGFMKNALTIGVTASPFFKIRNLIRDSVQVIGTSGIGVNPLSNVAQGWKLTDPKSDTYFRLLAGGGTIHFGTMLEGSEAKRVQSLVESGVESGTILNDDHKVKAFYRKFIEPGITAYNELGNRGEAVNRASLYAQLVNQGMSHAEASLQARDLMDFSMQGSFTSIRFLTQVVPFFNARIQGMYKLGRAAKEDPARFSAVIGAAAVISLGLLAAYSDDEDWKRRADWDRNNFWWFKFGGTAFRIPKPFEIGAVATLAERGFELAFDDEMTGTAFRKQVMTLLGDNLSMNPIPQIVKPVIEVYANKNSFTGAPIESLSQQRLKSEYRFNDRTSMAARGISTAMNSVTGIVGAESPSPVQVDHMLRGYFGWLGGFVIDAGDKLARPATSQTDQATPDYWKAATGGMVSDLRDAPSKYVSNIYDQAREIDQSYGTWKALIKQGDRIGALEFAQENKGLLAKRHLVESIKTHESKLNEQIRSIERSNIDGDEKRFQIRRINTQKEMLAKKLAPI